MPLTEGIITSVFARTQQRKSDGKTFTVYELTLNNQEKPKYQTFSRTLAGEANGMLNQRVEMDWHSEVRGSFENFYVDNLRLPTSNDYAAQAQPPQPQHEEYNPPQRQQEPPQRPPVQNTNGSVSDKDASIWRQTATKVSAQISKSPAEFWGNLDDIVLYYRTGEKPERFSRYVPAMINQHSEEIKQAEPERFVPAGAYTEPIIDLTNDPDGDIPFN